MDKCGQDITGRHGMLVFTMVPTNILIRDWSPSWSFCLTTHTTLYINRSGSSRLSLKVSMCTDRQHVMRWCYNRSPDWPQSLLWLWDLPKLGGEVPIWTLEVTSKQKNSTSEPQKVWLIAQSKSAPDLRLHPDEKVHNSAILYRDVSDESCQIIVVDLPILRMEFPPGVW